MCDSNGNGQIDVHEWRNFHDMFIIKFAAADKDGDLVLVIAEFTASFADLPQLASVVADKTSMP